MSSVRPYPWRDKSAYVEPTAEQLEAAYRAGRRATAEREATARPLPQLQAPSPGWNFGIGISGCIE